jgi:choline dehydrogenase-like flavoprotein
MTTRRDVAIIGSGAGGGTLAWALAGTGKRILILERGDYVPREKDNWSTRAVNLEGKYNTKEVWRDPDGGELHPHTNYYVGGNTKFYGAALFRLRREDFGEIKHYGGISPAWPISYEDLEPYYTRAEQLFLGQRIPLAGVAHQNGTIRFGRDPATSALDVNCKAHEVDNLYVVDASFFPSSAAVNPALTIMANALRVGEHLKSRLG